MKIFKVLKILFIINTLFLLSVGIVFAQDGEKVKDSTDTALVDGVKQIQKSKQEAEAGLDELQTEDAQDTATEVIEKEADGTVGVDLDPETLQEEEIVVDSDKPEPRITLEESLTRPLYQPLGKRDPFKPFIKEPKEKEAVISETTPPIKRFPLDEYRIVGIVWVDNVPKAMVVDPEKNTYFLGTDDEIGNKKWCNSGSNRKRITCE